MLKVTILYGHPKSADAFEQYYAGPHRAIAMQMKGMTRAEISKFVAGPDGEKPPFYRMAELYFEDEAQLRAWQASPEAKAAVADLPNFATGGLTIGIAVIETR